MLVFASATILWLLFAGSLQQSVIFVLLVPLWTHSSVLSWSPTSGSAATTSDVSLTLQKRDSPVFVWEQVQIPTKMKDNNDCKKTKRGLSSKIHQDSVVWKRVVERTTENINGKMNAFNTFLPTSAIDSFIQGDSIFLLSSSSSSVVTPMERKIILENARTGAINHRRVRAKNSLPYEGIVRLPTAEAAARAMKSRTPCAEPIGVKGSLVDNACRRILSRVLERIDEDLPDLREGLFGFGRYNNNNKDQSQTKKLHGSNILSIKEIYLRNGNRTEQRLVFASREPAVNVYAPGGQFMAHEDGQQLTILVPLSSPSSSIESHEIDEASFTGGGTAFWSSDSRGHRVDNPSLIVTPLPGTALLFVGHVTHAGLPVEMGERVVFVASFSIR